MLLVSSVLFIHDCLCVCVSVRLDFERVDSGQFEIRAQTANGGIWMALDQSTMFERHDARDFRLLCVRFAVDLWQL